MRPRGSVQPILTTRRAREADSQSHNDGGTRAAAVSAAYAVPALAAAFTLFLRRDVTGG